MHLLLFAVLAFVRTSSGEEDKAIKEIKIEGWNEDILKRCKEAPSSSVEYTCISYLWNYEMINLELLNEDPAIIVYRRLIPENYVDSFVADIRDEKKKSQISAQNATEITMEHTEKPGAARVFRRLSLFIRFITFSNSDPWQVLIFEKDQHMAPRRDYLVFRKGEKKDELTKRLGNRFATFTIALKSATQGGDYVFPAISSLYTVEPGDAIMWLNMTPKKEQETITLHGDCPVQSGEKITATLHLREHNQYLLMSTYLGEYYNYNMLVRPNLKFLGMSPVSFFYD